MLKLIVICLYDYGLALTWPRIYNWPIKCSVQTNIKLFLCAQHCLNQSWDPSLMISNCLSSSKHVCNTVVMVVHSALGSGSRDSFWCHPGHHTVSWDAAQPEDRYGSWSVASNCVRRYCILCYTDVNHGFGSGFIKLQTSSDLGLGPYTAWNTPRSHGSYIIRSAKAEPVAITASTYLL